MLTKTIPATSFASLFSLTFAFGAANVREVAAAASGGSTEDHASLKVARKLRRGKECSPSFQIEKNEDKIDDGILKTCPKDKDCVEDITSSLGGRCVDSAMSSESILSLSQGQLHGIDEARRLQGCTFDDGTAGVKCVGLDACADLTDIATIGCGSCNYEKACRYMGDNNCIAENSCNGNRACSDMGDNTIIAENSCNGNRACSDMGDNNTIAENSCNGPDTVCYRMGDNNIIAKTSCYGYRTCSDMGDDTTIADISCNGAYACSGMGDNTTIAEKSCFFDYACRYMGNDVTIADNSCVGYYACQNMGDNTIVNEKSCVGSIACEYMGNDVIVNENSCVGEQACNKLIGTGENSTDIGENSW